MKRILVIFNPAARSAKARALRKQIESLCDCALVETTRAKGDAMRIAQRAVTEGCDAVVAAGGDGTINEVVNGLAGSNVALGVIPVGTMNVFASELGLPSNNLRASWEVIEAGHIRKIDLASVNGHYFVQLAGIGLDAQVVKQTTWQSKRQFGPLSYLISAAQVAGQKPPRLVVETADGSTEGSFVLIGNGRFYGGPFVIFKEAKIDDGKLDVLVFKNLGFFDIVRYLNGVIFGTHLNLPDVDYFQTATLKVHSAQQVPMEADGELIGELPAAFKLMHRKLRVLAPAG